MLPSQATKMNTRLSGCLLLITAWTLSGCATHVPGGGPLRIGLFSRHEEDRSRALQRYCDADLYTYHQTCWRTAEFEPACSEPDSDCGEAVEKIPVETPVDASDGDSPPLPPDVTDADVEKDASINRSVIIEVAHEIKATDSTPPKHRRSDENVSKATSTAPNSIIKVAHNAEMFGAGTPAWRHSGKSVKKPLLMRRGNIGRLPVVTENDPAPEPMKPVSITRVKKIQIRR